MTVAQPTTIAHHVEDGIGTVILDRRGKHNALTQHMWGQIPGILEQLTRAGASSIVIRGAHGSFSAGADLAEVLEATASPAQAEEFCGTVVAALLAVARCPVPTVSRLSGIASGGGAELALASDMRIADETARLQLPLAGLGVVPDGFTLHRLMALTGGSTARYLLLTGRAITASECLRSGLVQQVTSPTELDDAVNDVVADLATKSPFALRHMKELALQRELALAGEDLTDSMVRSFLHGDVAKNAHKFLGRRKKGRDHKEVACTHIGSQS